MTAAPTWDLESIFPGGPTGSAFEAALADVTEAVEALVQRADALPELPESLDAWVAVITELYEAGRQFSQVRVFSMCHASADATNPAALRASAQTAAIGSRLQRAWVPVTAGVLAADDAAYAALVGRPELADARPSFDWQRAHRHLELPRAEQALATELSRDGIHGWGQLYDRVSGKLTVEIDGKTLGVGQASNLLGHRDAAVRADAMARIEDAWRSIDDLCASMLTHITGTRQVLNDRRGVDELADSLARNRLEATSLDAMMEAARRGGPLLERYLAAKARALGVERLAWQDVGAPLGSESAWSWGDAESFVLEHFGSWHAELRAFADRAFRERWIEAEDRPGKAQGGWCAPVVLHDGASRIFMTFGENFRTTTTLAHELGHAYHNHCMRDLPLPRRSVPSTLAETASVFAENIVRDAALEAATDDDARLAMLDARLAAGVSFLMDIPFRFELERSLYAMRRRGQLDPAELSRRTVELQRAAFRDSLASWNETFWASKLHFYISGFAFYNYPYAFGYLFSGLVYQRARAEGAAWQSRYVELLRRTGTDTAETLAADFLGLDLSDPDAWYGAIAPLEDDLAAFEALVG